MSNERRFFTDVQKRELFVGAAAQCQRCGSDLPEGWHAHHQMPHSEGGQTEIENGQALCPDCHVKVHQEAKLEETIRQFGGFRKDYSWQEQSIDKFIAERDVFYSPTRGQFQRAYVNEVSPSGGKTIFSMKLAARLIVEGLVDRVIWCVPRDSIKLGFEEDAAQVDMPKGHQLLGSPHIRIDTNLRSTYNGTLPNFHGMVITYQALPGMLGYFDLLTSKWRLLFVFDEAHHGASGESDDAMNVWGGAMDKCRSFANAVVCMTGTPLRSDSRTVPYIDYDDIQTDDGRAGWQVKPDYSFSYQRAVMAGIARKIRCRSLDAEITYDAEGDEGEIIQHCKVASAISQEHLNKVKNVAFCFTRGIVDDMLKFAHDESERFRATGDEDAAILVIGRRNAALTDNSLDAIKRRIEKLFGETASSVESTDGPITRDVIRLFKKGTGRWIVAKEMISEGTNIPRLRIVVILRDIGNRTFYEQLVHRVTRNDAEDRPEDAVIIQLHLRHLHEWGSDLEHQALIGFDKRQKLDERDPGDGDGESEVADAKYIEAIGAEFADETVMAAGEDLTDVDVLGRRLHALIGGETGMNTWHCDKTLKALKDNMGIPLNAAAAQSDKPDLFTPDEQIARYKERALKWIKGAAMNMGGDKAYAKITADCKRSVGIRGKLEDVIRDDPKAVERMRAFATAAERAFSASKRFADNLKNAQGAFL